MIDLAAVMAANFPYGLLRAGDIRDEINLNAGLAISNVMRMDYNAENLAYAEESGRVYEYDTNYIYLERETAVTADIELDGGYPAFDHGIEYFTGTTVPVYAVVLYGNNLKNKLERDVLTISAQELTAGQKAQVHANLGLNSIGMKFPDWVHASLLTDLRTTNGTYTATADGWLYMDISPSSNASSYEFKMTINDFVLSFGGKYTSNAYNRVPFLVPVKAGDVLVTTSSSTISWGDDRGPYFIPQR